MSWSRATSLLSTASVVHSTIARTRLIKVALRRAAFALKSKLTSFTCSRSAVIIHAYIGQTQRPTVNTRLPWLTAIRTTCRQAAATICPRPSSPPWAPRRLPPPSRRQRSSSFPRPTRSHAHRCSRLTHQHGGEQSGLVTLTFDLESGVRVTCDVGYLCANFGLPSLSVLDLGPMYATEDRQTSDKSIA